MPLTRTTARQLAREAYRSFAMRGITWRSSGGFESRITFPDADDMPFVTVSNRWDEPQVFCACMAWLA